ncbi:MAG: hypothetical protein IT310_14595 [Anaerolineales bacterium]|nr:hypothetical protein [Anaerolineales bacterium]
MFIGDEVGAQRHAFAHCDRQAHLQPDANFAVVLPFAWTISFEENQGANVDTFRSPDEQASAQIVTAKPVADQAKALTYTMDCLNDYYSNGAQDVTKPCSTQTDTAKLISA